MSLPATISRAVDIAFNKLDSLAKDVIFESVGSDFSFADGENSGTKVTATVRGLVVSDKRFNGSGVETFLSLVVKKRASELSGYTHVIVDGQRFSCTVLDTNDFVSTFELGAK